MKVYENKEEQRLAEEERAEEEEERAEEKEKTANLKRPAEESEATGRRGPRRRELTL